MRELVMVVLLCGLSAGMETGRAQGVTAAELVDRILDSEMHPGLSRGAIPDVAPDLRPLYGLEADRLIWFDGVAPARRVGRTLATLAEVDEHGLDPVDYDVELLGQQWRDVQDNTASAAERALFDVALSVATARVMRAVHTGRVDPATLHWGYTIDRKVVDPLALLQAVRNGPGLAATLDELQPPFAHYARARRSLRKYRMLAAAGEPAPVPELSDDRRKLGPGDSWGYLPALAERLRVLGDLRPAVAASLAEPTVYQGTLVDAVKNFQQRHGLEVDGIIGPATIGALNVTLAQRIRQIELAMERMRWLPPLGDRPNVFVNVPLFRLWATDPQTGEEPLRMNVVVGRSMGHQTPLFIEKMEYVILRPYWNPPWSIIVRELVPRERRDPGYFARAGFEIVASRADFAPELPPTAENLSAVLAGKYYLRQKPGPGNALGLAKFIFPNSEAVYMHGTPAQQLFGRTRRDFSHGCIRLENPPAFAEWILRDYPEWSADRIEAAMLGDRPTRVDLAEPLDVVLFYDTVHINSEGVEFFVEDIYGHDRVLDGALAQGYPYPIAN